jgi:hypothetical protein
MPLSAGRNRPSARRLGIRGGRTVTFEAHFAALLSAEEFEDTECAERTADDGRHQLQSLSRFTSRGPQRRVAIHGRAVVDRHSATAPGVQPTVNPAVAAHRSGSMRKPERIPRCHITPTRRRRMRCDSDTEPARLRDRTAGSGPGRSCTGWRWRQRDRNCHSAGPRTPGQHPRRP